MVPTGVLFNCLPDFILTGIRAEPKAAAVRFICSLDWGFSLRLSPRDAANFQTLDDPAGCFGGGSRFPGGDSRIFLHGRAANYKTQRAHPAVGFPVVLREDSAGRVVRERRGDGIEGNRPAE